MHQVVIGLLVYLAGLCVGSFLNVVIYRLPRGLSLSQPMWSFCPRCRATLRWYDNIPVLSWLLLRARCRDCGQPISAQYPLVEAITGLTFVLVYHLLLVAGARVLRVTEFGAWPLPAALPTDIPLVLAWLVLAAALVACSGMDLLWYVVDTRITDAALIAGLVLCALWPRPEFFAPRVATPAAAATFAALLVSGLMLWRTAWRGASDEPERGLTVEGSPEADASAGSSFRVATILAIAVFVALAVALLVAPRPPSSAGAVTRYLVPAALTALFVVMVLTGGQARSVDDELRAAIEAEAPASRRAVLREVLWLLPATAAAVAAYIVVLSVPAAADLWTRATTWMPFERVTPFGGLAFAAHGAIIAAAAGWTLRIFFTLVFGREAFGTGDIYILAAAGAVGGWDIALLGLLTSVFVALLGWILGLVLKRPGMIPFGPPLAIGFIAALWLNRPGAARAYSLYSDFREIWHTQPHMAVLLGGMMLIVLPFSILVARLTRRLVEPVERPAPGSPAAHDRRVPRPPGAG